MSDSYAQQAEAEMWDSIAAQDAPNPIIRETKLRAYPGWVVRQYRNGLYDATDGQALTLGYRSFLEAVGGVRESERR